MLATALLHLVSLLLAYAINRQLTPMSQQTPITMSEIKYVSGENENYDEALSQQTPITMSEIKYVSGENKDYDEALQFLEEHDPRQALIINKVRKAAWKYQSDLTEKNKKIMLEAQSEVAKFAHDTWKNATSFAWTDFKDRNETIYRWFKILAVLETAALPEEYLKEFNLVVTLMQEIYVEAKVCSKDNPPDKPCDLSLEPELTEIMAESSDYDELKRVWRDFHDATGKEVKDLFIEYVRLNNKVAKLNVPWSRPFVVVVPIAIEQGFSDAGEMWRDEYETDNLVELAENLWKETMPFYKQLHSYARKTLFKQYPDTDVRLNGPIPAHILGDMWAQDWSKIFPILMPFPNKTIPDVSKIMKEKKMTPMNMFKLSDDFFVSLGLKPMTPEFWHYSIIEKPEDRELVCHASAWDFFDGEDFRIKMCTKVDFSDFIRVHHEMGHIHYYQQYAHLPTVFRSGANPGFHEAIADTLALSVSTTSYLKKIGLLEEANVDNETTLNILMYRAYQKMAFLSYGYLVDKWRWEVFNGDIYEALNKRWWELRLRYQGICPPVRRSVDDLDIAAKYHVVANAPYFRYFVTHIIQFQFHKALCDAAGYVGPLHECDISGNKEAGKLLSETLRLGNSVHWSEAMNIITRGKTRNIDVKPLLEYFDPLIQWLKKHNAFDIIGWRMRDPMICNTYY